MDIAHKAVKVHTLLGRERQGFKKHIHQIGFASPHSTPHIKALDFSAFFTTSKPPFFGYRRGELLVNFMKEPHCCFFGRIVMERSEEHTSELQSRGQLVRRLL